MDVDLARQYMQYKRDQGLPTDQDNCLYFIHFLLEQEQPSNGVMWVSKEASQGMFHHAFQVIDKSAFARKYGILSDGKTIPKYDSIRRLLNNYAFHCDKKIIWYCSQLDDDGMRLFRPKKGYLLLKIKKKGYRTPSISYMYPGHDEEFWVPSYASPYNSFPIPALAPHPQATQMVRAGLPPNATPSILSSSSSGNITVPTRTAFDPPLQKKRKVGEGAMGDEDAAALLTDLGRSASPPSSPRRDGSPRLRVLSDSDDGADDSKDDEYHPDRKSQLAASRSASSALSAFGGSSDASGASGSGDDKSSAGKPYVYRPRRVGRSVAPLSSSPEPLTRRASQQQPLNGASSSPPRTTSVVANSVVGGGVPQQQQQQTQAGPAGGLLGPLFPANAASSASPSAFFHQQPSSSTMPFTWPAAADVYKLYAAHQRPFGTGVLDSFPVDAASFQQRQQQLQILQAQQQLYNAQLAQSGNSAAQAFLQHQQNLAQLALQQQAHLQMQTQAQAQAQAQAQQQQRQQQQQQQQQQQSNMSSSSEVKEPSLSPATSSLVQTVPSSAVWSTPSVKPEASEAGILLTLSKSSSSSIKAEDHSMDAESTASADSMDCNDDGYSTPDCSRPRQRKAESEPLTLSEANAMSKRNKFFYKQLRDHLDYGNANVPIGFVNDIFFLMDPKLHVGPLNRDGTYEKRVRLHFIEYLELKHNGFQLWLCWGTLLDSAKTPIFRRSSHFYRIPGNQSVVLKSHSRAPQDWDVADDDAKMQLRTLATSIKTELDSKWDGSDITSARSLVDGLKLVLPTSPPLDEKGDFLPIPNDSQGALFQELLQNCMNRSPVPAQSAPVSPTDPRSAALRIWRSCGLSAPQDVESDNLAWTEVAVTMDAQLEAKLGAAFGLTDHVESQLKLFRLFVVPQGKFTFSDLELALRRFGETKLMFIKMLDLLSTGAFNGNMSAAATRSFLNDQPDGSYLIRYSQSFPENFVLCWKVEGTVDQMNKIFNQPTGGLEIELEGRLCQVTQWASIIRSCASMRIPQISTPYAHFKEHGIPLTELLADNRFQIPGESFTMLPASSRMDVDASSESDDAEATTNTTTADSKASGDDPNSHADSVNLARHELEVKIAAERSADILSYLSKLRAQSRIAPGIFHEWCLFVSSAKSKDVTTQLHSLLQAFREEPDLWIAFANEVIPTKLVV